MYCFIIFIISSCSEDKYDAVEDIQPIATDDIKNYEILSIVTIPVIENDTTGDTIIPSSISIKNGEDTNGDGTLDKLIIENEGIWNTIQTGLITFTPSNNFFESPTSIKYTVKDAQGNTSNEANVTVTAVSSVNINLSAVPYPKLSEIFCWRAKKSYSII
jgi:hypothetical protein